MRSLRFPGGGIVSGPDEIGQSVQVNGKTVYFDFDVQFGPLITDKDGVPLKRQPVSESHPFWGPFNIWLAEWRKANPPKPAPAHPSDAWDRRA